VLSDAIGPLSVCPVCDIGVLRPSGWMDQNATSYGGRPWPRPHCVRWGPSSPPKGAHSQYSAHVYCGQMAGWIKMSLGMEVGLSPGHVVLDGDPAPSKRGTVPHPPFFGPCLLWPNSWMDQDVTWYRGGLIPGYIMLDGDASPPKKGHCTPPPKWSTAACTFGPYLLWPNGWMDQDVTWYGSRPQPRPYCVRWGPSSLKEGHSPHPPFFGPCLL